MVGLAQLAEAFACAQDGASDVWEFAIGLETLLAAGVGESELRWLVAKGYAEHACETTTARDARRKFRPGRNLAFQQRTSFILTEAGSRFAATVLGVPAVVGAPRIFRGDDATAPPAELPRWDGQRRTLLAGDTVVKQFKLPSPNQEAILATFEEEGWPSHIDDPLSPEAEQNPKCRLHDTIKRLNRHHKQSLIRFSGDGTGEGVCWERVAAVTLPLPAAARPKKSRRAA